MNHLYEEASRHPSGYRDVDPMVLAWSAARLPVERT